MVLLSSIICRMRHCKAVVLKDSGVATPLERWRQYAASHLATLAGGASIEPTAGKCFFDIQAGVVAATTTGVCNI